MKNTDFEVDFQKLEVSKKRVDLETLMRLCTQLEQELKNTRDPLYKVAKKAYVLAKDLCESESVEKKLGIEIPVLAKYYNVRPIEFRKVLRSLGVLDRKNKPTEEFNRWFITDNCVYFSASGHRCVVQKIYFKKCKLKYLDRLLKKECGSSAKWLRL